MASAPVGVPSIVSADLKIVGDLNSSGDLQIDGAVEGNITSRSLIVGEGAVVKGTLVADNLRIYGSVVGQVRATSVILAKTAKVEGDVAHQSISVEAGAVLLGCLSRLGTPVGGVAQPAAAAEPSPKSNGSSGTSAAGERKPQGA